MTGFLSPEQIESVLKGQKIGRVGCHANGRVYVVPLMYGYDGGAIYGHSDEGLKLQMMRQNPAVCFEVEQIISLTNWQMVVVWGRFEQLESPEDVALARRLLRERFTFDSDHDLGRPSARMFEPSALAADMKPLLFRIVIDEKSGRFEKSR